MDNKFFVAIGSTDNEKLKAVLTFIEVRQEYFSDFVEFSFTLEEVTDLKEKNIELGDLTLNCGFMATHCIMARIPEGCDDFRRDMLKTYCCAIYDMFDLLWEHPKTEKFVEEIERLNSSEEDE